MPTFAIPNNKTGVIAQLVEQRTENPCVPGSIPGDTTENLSRSNSAEVFSYWETCAFKSKKVRNSYELRTFVRDGFCLFYSPLTRRIVIVLSYCCGYALYESKIPRAVQPTPDVA